jgi:hypothetical protein
MVIYVHSTGHAKEPLANNRPFFSAVKLQNAAVMFLSEAAGLPDGSFSNQKSQFG